MITPCACPPGWHWHEGTRCRETNVYLSGRGTFGAHVAAVLSHEPGVRVVGVASPALRAEATTDDGSTSWDRLRLHAYRAGLPWTDAPALRARHVPEGTDVIVAAHSHAFIGRATRARARYTIGYHPSLLPLHRGRDAIRWTVRDGDRVCGGTVYHLTDNVDGGPIAAQDYVLTPRGATPRELWGSYLFEMGVDLLTECVRRVVGGDELARVPQDESLATWEPALDSPPLYRPELPELTSGVRRG